MRTMIETKIAAMTLPDCQKAALMNELALSIKDPDAVPTLNRVIVNLQHVSRALSLEGFVERNRRGGVF